MIFGAKEMLIFIFVFSIIGASNWQNLCKKGNCMQVLIIPEKYIHINKYFHEKRHRESSVFFTKIRSNNFGRNQT